MGDNKAYIYEAINMSNISLNVIPGNVIPANVVTRSNFEASDLTQTCNSNFL